MNRTGISLCVVSKIVNAQIQNVAVERVPDIGKRPNGRIERAVVDQPDQLRQGLRRYCIGH